MKCFALIKFAKIAKNKFAPPLVFVVLIPVLYFMKRPQIKNLTYMIENANAWCEYSREQDNFIDYQQGLLEDKDAEINELQHKIQELEGVIYDNERRYS